jgi:hypothetical protein
MWHVRRGQRRRHRGHRLYRLPPAAARRYRRREQVARHDPGGLLAQEAPARSWSPIVARGQARDGAEWSGSRLPRPNAEVHQFAVDALVAPAGILGGQADDQLLHILGKRWPASVAVRGGPAPGASAALIAASSVRSAGSGLGRGAGGIARAPADGGQGVSRSLAVSPRASSTSSWMDRHTVRWARFDSTWCRSRSRGDRGVHHTEPRIRSSEVISEFTYPTRSGERARRKAGTAPRADPTTATVPTGADALHERVCAPFTSLTEVEQAALAATPPGTRLEVVVEPTGPAWLPIAVLFTTRGHTVYRVSSAKAADLRRFCPGTPSPTASTPTPSPACRWSTRPGCARWSCPTPSAPRWTGACAPPTGSPRPARSTPSASTTWSVSCCPPPRSPATWARPTWPCSSATPAPTCCSPPAGPAWSRCSPPPPTASRVSPAPSSGWPRPAPRSSSTPITPPSPSRISPPRS